MYGFFTFLGDTVTSVFPYPQGLKIVINSNLCPCCKLSRSRHHSFHLLCVCGVVVAVVVVVVDKRLSTTIFFKFILNLVKNSI